MKVLFLGGNMAESLAEWLRQQGEKIIYTVEKITIDEVNMIAPEFIVSYNYRYILPKSIIDVVIHRRIYSG